MVGPKKEQICIKDLLSCSEGIREPCSLSASAELWGVCAMAWTLHFLLTLLLHCTGSLSQPALTQPASASTSLGASAKLTCTLSSGYSSYNVDWYQQGPGKGPRFLVRVGNSGAGSKGDGVPDRFSGSGSGLDRYLTIQNFQAENQADYYCAASHDSGSSSV